MKYEVWIGTPNEMGKAATKDTLPTAIKWGRDHVEALRKQAEKYDRPALEHMAVCREEMQKLASIPEGESRGWQFPYIAVIFRIEIRRTSK